MEPAGTLVKNRKNHKTPPPRPGVSCPARPAGYDDLASKKIDGGPSQGSPPSRPRFSLPKRPMSPSILSLRAGLFSLLCGLAVAPAAAQGPPPLRLDGLMSGGARASVTEAWGTFNFSVTNLSDQDRRARVLLSYEGGPDAPQDRTQYGRDVWVPARSTLSSWLLAGPAPARRATTRGCSSCCSTTGRAAASSG